MSDEKRPPHPATVAVERAPHAATVQRREAPFGMPKVPPPHPATMQRVVVQPKAVQERAPHPAMVQRKGEPMTGPAPRRPHPATVVQRVSSDSSSSAAASSPVASSLSSASSVSSTYKQPTSGGFQLPDMPQQKLAYGSNAMHLGVRHAIEYRKQNNIDAHLNVAVAGLRYDGKNSNEENGANEKKAGEEKKVNQEDIAFIAKASIGFSLRSTNAILERKGLQHRAQGHAEQQLVEAIKTENKRRGKRGKICWIYTERKPCVDYEDSCTKMLYRLHINEPFFLFYSFDPEDDAVAEIEKAVAVSEPG